MKVQKNRSQISLRSGQGGFRGLSSGRYRKGTFGGVKIKEGKEVVDKQV
jgi:hypothetical protein